MQGQWERKFEVCGRGKGVPTIMTGDIISYGLLKKIIAKSGTFII